MKTEVEFEQIVNPEYDSSYAYLCVDQRPVKPGKSQRRPGWHADSFVTPLTHDDTKNVLHDSIYITSDCIPTIYNPGPFPFNGQSSIHLIKLRSAKINFIT